MFRNRYKITCSLFLLLCAVSTFCQPIRFDHISIKEGLSQSSVNCIHQDKSGYIWIGTQDGLNRYDGYDFTVFYHDPYDSTSIYDNYIYDIHEDTAGYLWIVMDNGLSKFDPNTNKFSSFEHILTGLEDNTFFCITEDDKGFLWIGTAKDGLIRFDKKTEQVKIYNNKSDKYKLPHNAIKSILIDRQNRFWIGTDGAYLALFDKEKESFTPINQSVIPEFKGKHVQHLFEDTYNNVWTSTTDGLFVLRWNNLNDYRIAEYTIENTSLNSLGGNNIHYCFQDKKGNVWIAVEGGGLNKIDNAYYPETIFSPSKVVVEKQLHNPDLSTGLPTDLIQYAYEDHAGIIWVGTSNGISKFDPGKQFFRHYRNIPNNNNSLNQNTVWAISEDSFNKLWVGTRKGLNRINRSNGEVTRFEKISYSKEFRNNQSVLSIYSDPQSNLFVGTVEGLYKVRFSQNQNEVLGFDRINYTKNTGVNGLENRVYTMRTDQNGKMWIGTKNGLFRYDIKNKTSEVYKHDPENPLTIGSNTVRVILKDQNNTIWIGCDGGLAKVVEQDSGEISFTAFKHDYKNPETISNNLVVTIWEGEDGNFWIGTYGGGLNSFNPETEKFKRFTAKDGLLNNVIYGVLGDNKGNLWMSTNKGVSQFNLFESTIRTYQEQDGLQSNEFNTGAYFKNRQGEMFFGGINGFNIFDPVDVKINKSPPKMVISNFLLFNKEVIPGNDSPLKRHISSTRKVILTYSQDNFSFEYSALHYGYSEKNNYLYMLKGVDEDWVNAGTRRFAPYTNIDPGEYTFIVKGCNSDGVWSDKPAYIEVVITPPFWETWPFRIIVAILILGAAWGVIIARINFYKDQKRKLEILVEERTHEVIEQKEQIQIQKEELQKEKEKSEELLLKVLPRETAEELRNRGKTTPRQYRRVSVMFMDVRNFTKISENLGPRELVAELDKYFIEWDKIIEKYNIEKIKTMGDAYMCAGGVPIRNKSNPVDIILAALEIQQYMDEIKKTKLSEGVEAWEIRIGIHTGEVTAGVVGQKRFAYDIWGDTVNVANRMETTCDPGRINISGKTYQYVKNFFQCEYRGKIKAKNKGEVDMYYVDGIAIDLSKNQLGFEPNDVFRDYVNLEMFSTINYRAAEQHILQKLEKELSNELYYHCVEHTVDVCHSVEKIAKAEGVKGEDLFLLKTAALYHDSGFILKYLENESEATDLAREYLPEFGYTPEQIDQISRLILATRIPQEPQSHLEEILCDADLDYLGRPEFHDTADKLKLEFLAHRIVKNEKAWDELQVKFISAHRFFTKTARETRSEKKFKHLEEIRKRLKTTKYS